MNKRMIAVVLSCLLFAACANEKVSVLTPAQQQAKIDSIVKLQQREIREAEAQNLRDRMSIEVKEKADSIWAIREKSRILPAPVPRKQDSADKIQDTLSHKNTL